MPARASRPLLPGLALVAALAGGCGPHNQADDFPLAVGFQPLEPMVAVEAAPWPAATSTDPHPQGLGPVAHKSTFSHYGSHARGYLHAPLARVYQALHDPASSLIHNTDGGPRLDGPPAMGVEPFPVSFRVRYANSTPVGEVKFDVTYRAGPLEGTEADPIAIGQRYQKTWGVANISVMTGSLVARAVEGAPDVTSVEMIAWLSATTQDQADCDGTVRDLFGDLEATLAAMP